MKKLRSIAAAAGLTCMLLGASAGAAPLASADSTHNYNCSNQGGGPNHKVTCSGTAGGSPIVINVSDIHVLSDNQLTVLEDSLNNTVVNVDILTTLKNIELNVLNVYKNNFGIPINVTAISVCCPTLCL